MYSTVGPVRVVPHSTRHVVSASPITMQMRAYDAVVRVPANGHGSYCYREIAEAWYVTLIEYYLYMYAISNLTRCTVSAFCLIRTTSESLLCDIHRCISA